MEHQSASSAEQTPTSSGLAIRRIFTEHTEGWILLAALLAPIITALTLTPGRGHLDTADDALILVVVIVAVASTGRRLAAATAALTSALAFDFFLTRPYNSFRITTHQDLITEILLLVVGLSVGELAARGRSHRLTATSRRDELTLLHQVTELAATGQESPIVIQTAISALCQLLILRDCSFTETDPDSTAAQITPHGDLMVGTSSWATESLGLPTKSVDLPVRNGGRTLGHFLLTPTPGSPIAPEQLIAAVAIADQVGSTLAARHPTPA
jgi:K+-sensing histidine kinase KdpD